MSDADKSQKTEEATSKRLKKSREKGQVSSSKDLVTILMMISVIIYFYVRWDDMWQSFQAIVVESTKLIHEPFLDSLGILADTLFKRFLSIIGPMLAIIIVIAIFAHLIQFGFIFSFESIMPKLSKISPISGFKKIFSWKNFLEFIKSLLKIIIISISGYFVFRQQIDDLIKVPQCKLECALPLLNDTIAKTVKLAIPTILFIAILDVFIQRKIFLAGQRMTKEETKRERKEDTGDPTIVSQRKSLHKEIVSEGIHETVQAATLIVFDYGDKAVILNYDGETMPLPLISMITRGAMTEKIRDMARDFKKTTVRDGSLAADLIRHGTQGQFIPGECVEGVAKALRSAG